MSDTQLTLDGQPTAADDTVQACPACDSSRIWSRGHAGVNDRGRATDGDWKCKNCGEVFDEPEPRPPKSGGQQPTNGLAATLASEDVTNIDDVSEALGD
jgi:ribosomal protein L37AE/L43A